MLLDDPRKWSIPFRATLIECYRIDNTPIMRVNNTIMDVSVVAWGKPMDDFEQSVFARVIISIVQGIPPGNISADTLLRFITFLHIRPEGERWADIFLSVPVPIHDIRGTYLRAVN